MGSMAVCEALTSSSKKSTGREKTVKAFTSCSKGTRTRSSNSPSSFVMTDLDWTDKISACPVYYPSIEEFEDPLSFLQKVAPEASRYGICKIVSPVKASIPASDVLTKERRGFKFRTYGQPLRLARWNVKDKATFFKGGRNYTYQTFESMAMKAFAQRLPRGRYLSPAKLEKRFWQEMVDEKEDMVQYGVNIEGSAFSSCLNDQLGKSRWNLKTISQLSKSTFRLLGYQIPGITDPMLYIGMLFSMFAWHVEDHYLYSLNYHHSGAPKTWYGVPGHASDQFEKVALDHVYINNKLFPDTEDQAFELLAHKTTMFPPNILLQHDVPVYKTVQMPGEFVITFPRAYHAGFSHGFNCGEAVNFALGDWFPWGAMAAKRYALLSKTVILPFEELLCKEATLLSKSPRNTILDYSSAELTSQSAIKVSFLEHIQSIKIALCHYLNDLRALFSYSPNSQETILCHLCKRDCYLAFLECSGCYHHMCLFHEVRSLNCSCSGKHVVRLREDICEVVEAAQKLEVEEIQEEIQQEKCTYLDIFSCIQDGFALYAKKNLHWEECPGNCRGCLRYVNRKERNQVE